MKYIVIEFQTDDDNVATIVNQYSDLQQAESAYHQILTFAAVSTIEYHGALLMNSEGAVYHSDRFTHPVDDR